jgi:hypothetical protein
MPTGTVQCTNNRRKLAAFQIKEQSLKNERRIMKRSLEGNKKKRGVFY